VLRLRMRAYCHSHMSQRHCAWVNSGTALLCGYGITLAQRPKSKSESKSCYDWRSVLVSSSLWSLWPDIIFWLKVAVLSLWGALSDERSGLSPVSHCHQCLVHCQRFNIIYIVHVTCFKYMQYILDLWQHRLSTAVHDKICFTTAI
jgi:hypothetical protein